jgi:hypothetical protein
MLRPPAPRNAPALAHRLLEPTRTGQRRPRRERRHRLGLRAARRPPQHQAIRGPSRHERPAIRGPSRHERRPARGQQPDQARLRPGPRRHGPAQEQPAQREGPVQRRLSPHRLRAEPGQRRRSRVRLVPPGHPVRGRARRARRLPSQATGGRCPLRGPGPTQRRPSSARQGQRPEADELATGTTKDAPAGQRDRRVE